MTGDAAVILRSEATKNPKAMREYYVYILTNETHRLYVGVTSDLQRRMYQHKNKLTPGFASRYNLRWAGVLRDHHRYSACDSSREADKGMEAVQKGRLNRIGEL